MSLNSSAFQFLLFNLSFLKLRLFASDASCSERLKKWNQSQLEQISSLVIWSLTLCVAERHVFAIMKR